MDTDLKSLVKSIIAKWKANEFSFELVFDILALVMYFADLAKQESPVFGESMGSGETGEALNQLYLALEGTEPPMSGILSRVTSTRFRILLLARAMEILGKLGVSRELVALLTDSIKERLLANG